MFVCFFFQSVIFFVSYATTCIFCQGSLWFYDPVDDKNNKVAFHYRIVAEKGDPLVEAVY
jgi:hypothetical protein